MTMHGMLSRAGRKRKGGIVPIREPGGRLSRSIPKAELGEPQSPSQVKRLRDAALSGMRDAEWGTELGRLFLEGKITALHYATGKWWAILSARARMAFDGPKEAPASSAFVEKSGGHAPDPDSDMGREQATKDRAAVVDFMAAHGALIGAGQLPEHAVRSVCEDNKTITGHQQLVHLNLGLEWLYSYRDLTERNSNGRKSK